MRASHPKRVLEFGIASDSSCPTHGRAATALAAPRPFASNPRHDGVAVARPHRPVELINRSAEAIPQVDGSRDVEVTTFTLCCR